MALPNMSERYTRPDWVRRINAMGESVGGAHRLVPLDIEALVAEAVASGLSTLAMVRWLRSDDVEPEGLTGPDNALMLDLMAAIGTRRDAGELPGRFVDVHFADLMRDPVAAIAGAYERMGRELGGAHADAVRRYVADKPKGKFGAHRYDPEEWGFDSAALRARAKPYTDRFGVRLED